VCARVPFVYEPSVYAVSFRATHQLKEGHPSVNPLLLSAAPLLAPPLSARRVLLLPIRSCPYCPLRFCLHNSRLRFPANSKLNWATDRVQHGEAYTVEHSVRGPLKGYRTLRHEAGLGGFTVFRLSSYDAATCLLLDLETAQHVCVYVCTYLVAPAHARTRAHRPVAPRQSSGVSQKPHPTACLQAGIPH